MKFTNGMWFPREGYNINWTGHVARTWTTDDRVDLLLVKPQHGIGDSLNTPSITASIRSPLQGVVAVKFTHWDGADNVGPHYELFEDDIAVQLEHVGEKLTFTSKPLQVQVNTAQNELDLTYNFQSDGEAQTTYLTGHSHRSIGFVAAKHSSGNLVVGDMFTTPKHYMLLGLDLSVHEKIYGLGERFGPFIRNGQAVDMWNEDGGTSSEQAYKNIPFYFSSRGYGVFVNHPGKVMFEVQSERTTRVNIAVEGESLEYMVIAGPTPKDVLNRYTTLTGRPSLPPAWSYGLWLSTSFQTSYTKDSIDSLLDGLKTRSIPLSVFHLDACWMKSFQYCDFAFDMEQIPDPEPYLKRIKARGLKICVWMNPFVAQASSLFADGKKNGYFIMRADTVQPTVYQMDLWQAGMAIVDFTNPAARTWFCGHLAKLLDMGIDCLKTDFGERIPFDPKQVRYHDGSDSVRMHNYYSFLFNKTVHEFLQDYKRRSNSKPSNPIVFARAATTGCQRFPVHWSGDCESTFPAMAETLRGGLSLGLSGFAFWAHDIGGFEGTPEPALYKRWVQFGCLSSHSRLHGSSSYRVPWIYSEDEYPGEAERCSAVLRDAVKRKLSLMPYLLRAALDAKVKGTPVMRAMLIEFGDRDFNTWMLDTQFMLGGDLLVAPVFDRGGEVRFYVPETGNSSSAKWRSWFNSEKTYEEGKWYVEHHNFDSFPLLIRPGATIPFNLKLESPEGDYLDGLQVIVNGPLKESRQIEIVLPEDVERVCMNIVVNDMLEVKNADGITVVDLSDPLGTH